MRNMTHPRPIGKSRLRQWALLALRSIAPKRRLLVSGDSKVPTVYLTFDDGPDPETTPDILDVLRRHRVLATFFVVGRQVQAHPDIVRRISAEGHTIGGHTFSHQAPQETTSKELIGEIRQTDLLLRKIIGQGCRLFRPPFGKLTFTKLFRLWADRRTIVLWNRDPKDFSTSSSKRLATWFRANPLVAGDVILLHDTSASTATVLDEVIVHTRRSGLDFSPLD